MKGWRVASKRLGPLPRIKWAALGRGCGREGSGALPLPRAAAVSTGLRVHEPLLGGEAPTLADDGERASDVRGVAMVLCAHVEQREVARAHLPAVGPARVAWLGLGKG